MKYRLSERYALRGYRNRKDPVVLDLKTHQRFNVTGESMTLLKMCDGETDISAFVMIPMIKKMAEIAVRNGWIVQDMSGRTVAPEQRYRESPAPDVIDFHWSVTGKCNARRRHCYIGASQGRHRDLTTSEMLEVIDKIGSCNIPTVCLTGGEPLCRSDLSVLLKAMSKNNIHVTRVCTNGFLLTDDILDMFEQNGDMPAFQISFDGVGCHDWMRGVRGAEEMAVRAMEVCRRRAAQVVLTMCLHKGNIRSGYGPSGGRQRR